VVSERSKYCCPTCGHPVLPTDPLAILPPTQRAIFDVIYAAGQAGVTREAITQSVYGKTVDGGPMSWRQLVSVHLIGINHRIRFLNLKITSDRSRPKSYFVSPLRDFRDKSSQKSRTKSTVRATVNSGVR